MYFVNGRNLFNMTCWWISNEIKCDFALIFAFLQLYSVLSIILLGFSETTDVFCTFFFFFLSLFLAFSVLFV